MRFNSGFKGLKYCWPAEEGEEPWWWTRCVRNRVVRDESALPKATSTHGQNGVHVWHIRTKTRWGQDQTVHRLLDPEVGGTRRLRNADDYQLKKKRNRPEDTNLQRTWNFTIHIAVSQECIKTATETCSAIHRGCTKPLAPGRPGDLTVYCGAWCLRILSIRTVPCHPARHKMLSRLLHLWKHFVHPCN